MIDTLEEQLLMLLHEAVNRGVSIVDILEVTDGNPTVKELITVIEPEEGDIPYGEEFK
jgi:hypothetical protein